MGPGVLGGATIANQVVEENPGTVSDMAGIAPFAADGDTFKAAILDMGRRRTEIIEHQVDMTCDKIVQCRRQSAIWHVHEFDTGHGLELLDAQVLHGSYSGGREAELSWIALGVGYQFFCA